MCIVIMTTIFISNDSFISNTFCSLYALFKQLAQLFSTHIQRYLFAFTSCFDAFKNRWERNGFNFSVTDCKKFSIVDIDRV